MFIQPCSSALRIPALAMVAAAWSFTPASGQERRADMPVTPATRDSVALAAAETVEARYVFADKGTAAARAVRQGVRAGRYRRLETASALSDSLTADLRRGTGDKHLQVQFSATPRTAAPDAGLTAADSARDLENAQWRNFGFHAVERLDGNVGYVEMGRFDNPELAGGALATAMSFLAQTDALIIDLRNTGGGFAAMEALVTSYFIAEPKLLSTLHRRGGDTAHLWTPARVAGPRYLDKPVYVLVSGRTFSAPEALAYDLQALGRAVVVGEQTRGGANPGGWVMLGSHFAVAVPTARLESAITHGNWEGVGVRPDMPVAAAGAKKAAHRAALQRLVAENASAVRAPRWSEALEELRADDARSASATAPQ
ncbi:S41 family peptidase [Longimicrobium sp.]|jgi:C-terminal processing protease CtpA/Prc|uniref:S41 family peptidase n=1 Tax=Longimicrobium sp. TaxID=2029185 RepID=UPI002ED9BFBD